MTEEQYIRAVQISNKLGEPNKVKDEIKDKKKRRLWYAYNRGEFGSEIKILVFLQVGCILLLVRNNLFSMLLCCCSKDKMMGMNFI